MGFHTRIKRRTVYQTGRLYGVGPTAVKYLLILLVGVFTLFYLTQTSEGASQIVKMRNITAEKAQLDQDYSALEVEATRLQSLNSLTEYIGKNQMVPNGQAAGVIELNTSATPTQ